MRIVNSRVQYRATGALWWFGLPAHTADQEEQTADGEADGEQDEAFPHAGFRSRGAPEVRALGPRRSARS